MKKLPRIFDGRTARSLEEFVTLYFEAGRKRNAARRLWRALEAEFQVDLSRLHPDDTMGAVIGEVDSLGVVQFIAVLEELDRSSPVGSVSLPDRTFAECTFRNLVDLLA